MMASLARSRNARDMWISRSHIGAGLVGVLVIAALSAGAGIHMGRVQVAGLDQSRVASVEIPDGDLLDLIARVEATAVIDGGVNQMTFPDVLSGKGGAIAVPTLAGVEAPTIVVAPAPGSTAPKVDTIPRGTSADEVSRFVDPGQAAMLRDGLRSAGHTAWLGLEIVDGVRFHTVSVEHLDQS